MIYYDSPSPAPNPRRVRVFAAEKGITLETQAISIIAREHKTADYLAINPRGQTPALALGDGSVITESVAICRYLEALNPEPALFGTGAAQIASIEMWSRRVEFVLGDPVSKVWVHCHPFTAKVMPVRFPDFGESNRPRAFSGMKMCDDQLAETPFLAGDSFSMADILLLTTIDFAHFIGLEMPEPLTHLRRWHTDVSARPSASA